MMSLPWSTNLILNPLKGRGFDPHSDQPVLKFSFFGFLIFVSVAQPAKPFIGFGRLCIDQGQSPRVGTPSPADETDV